MHDPLSPSRAIAALAAAALLLPATTPAPRGQDALALRPAAGARVERELAIEASLDLEDLWARVDGEEMPAEMLLDQFDEAIVFELALSVSDELVSCEAGRHRELVRTFESIVAEGGMESETEPVDELAELVDHSVRFTWDEQELAYEVTFVEGDADARLLEGLEVDMDFLALLPDRDVEVDDRWEASGDRIGTVFLPGGLGGPDEDLDQEGLQLAFEALEEELDAIADELVLRCRYAGTRSVEGTEVGVVEVEYDVETSLDLSGALEALLAQQEIPVEIDATLTLDIELRGNGTLLWNLAAGHVHSFEMQAELTLLLDAEADVEAEGESHSAEASAEVYGEVAWSLTTG